MSVTTDPALYPCPHCWSAMQPGWTTVTIPPPPAVRGQHSPGKVYSGHGDYSAHSSYVDCLHCNGTGQVAERRQRTRRVLGDRRS